ncbi:MAG: MOSC domain-containing protein [Phycicoccus sp.]|nr:MOSC domain-containing protein [Phycicoccus sp.]NMM34984.1 MOSC domain-containing protein [Phycicoccus sp.]
MLSVNLARVRPNPDKREVGLTGIDKLPTTEPVLVRAPGTKRDGVGSGLVGDMVGDRLNHGGDAQAVYAYAREDLDHWESVLGRTLAGGVFGENLTTTGIDVNAAVIGERWAIGDELELAVTVPRIPCGTFRAWIAERGWLRTFARAAMPGTYLSVVRPGLVRAGDPITVVHRPSHGVTVAQVFRALTLEPELLSSILAADELLEETKERARAGRTFSLD